MCARSLCVCVPNAPLICLLHAHHETRSPSPSLPCPPQGPSSKTALLLNSTCTAYSLSQLQQATDGWSDANLLGRGGFGEVYRGVDPNNPSVAVAVKRATVQTKKFKEEVRSKAFVGREKCETGLHISPAATRQFTCGALPLPPLARV